MKWACSDDGIIRTPDVRGYLHPFTIGLTYTMRIDDSIRRLTFLGTETGGMMRWVDHGPWPPVP